MTRRRRLAALTIVGLTGVGLGLASNAVMSGSRPASVDAPGGLEISSIDLTTGTRGAVLSARDMVPGGEVTAAVTVANSGRQPLTYSMRRDHVSAEGDALSAALVLTIRTIGSSCADFDGTTLFAGPLDEAAFGRAGDDRRLPGATAEILCFRAALPLESDNRLQGATTTVSLWFDARLQGAVP